MDPKLIKRKVLPEMSEVGFTSHSRLFHQNELTSSGTMTGPDLRNIGGHFLGDLSTGLYTLGLWDAPLENTDCLGVLRRREFLSSTTNDDG